MAQDPASNTLVCRPRPSPALDRLPAETLEQIATLLPSLSDVNSLVQTCRCLFQKIKFFLYQLDASDFDRRALLWAAVHGLERTACNALDAGTPVDTFCSGTEDLGIKRLLTRHRTALHISVAFGHVSLVRLLLDAHADATGTNDRGQTPLFEAAARGCVPMLQMLLEHSHSQINTHDNAGRTPLSEAVRHGHIEAVNVLLSFDDIDLNHSALDCPPPVILAARYGHEDILWTLLDRGVRVEIQDSDMYYLCGSEIGSAASCIEVLLQDWASDINTIQDGVTVLHEACRAGSPRVVDLLLRHGASIQAAESTGTLPLDQACESGNAELVRLLLTRGARFSTRSSSTGHPSAIKLAATHGHADVVEDLLSTGLRDDLSKDEVVELLQLACEVGSESTFRVLFYHDEDHGAFTTKDWLSLLYHACGVRRPKVLEQYEERSESHDLGSDPNDEPSIIAAIKEDKSSRHGIVAIILRVIEEHHNDETMQKVFTSLQPNPARPRNRKFNHTVLERASINGHLPIVQTVLLVGERMLPGWAASVLSRNDNAALEYACGRGDEWDFISMLNQDSPHTKAFTDEMRGQRLQIAKLLLSHGAKVTSRPSPLHAACSCGYLNIAVLLLSLGADPHATDVTHSTPLEKACRCGDADIVRLLLDAGANPHGQPSGPNPLLSACSVIMTPGHADVVALLLSLGLDVNILNQRGDTPLLAACRRDNLTADTVKRLVQAGAGVEARNRQGKTPLLVACWKGNYRAVKCLIEHGADVGATDYAGYGAAYYACERGSESIFNLLLSKGVSPLGGAERIATTPLYAACSRGHAHMLRTLLSLGADPLRHEHGEVTPLHLACACKDGHEVVEVLLARGASPWAEDNRGSRPLGQALRSDSYWSVKLLAEAGALLVHGEGLVPGAGARSITYCTSSVHIKKYLEQSGRHINGLEIKLLGRPSRITIGGRLR